MPAGLTVALSGDDTFQYTSGSISAVASTLANQDPGHVVFPNEMATVEQGKQGGVIYAENRMGFIADFTGRFILGAIDDQNLNSLQNQQISGFSGFGLITAVFTKRVGDGKGNIASVIYQLSGGIFTKGVEAKSSARGDVEQSVAVWMIRFGSWVRLIQ